MGLHSFAGFCQCKCLSAASRKSQVAGEQWQQGFAGISHSAVGRNRLEPGLQECSWKQCNYATHRSPENVDVSSEGPSLHRLWLCSCERGGALMSLGALSLPKPLKRSSTTSCVFCMLSLGKYHHLIVLKAFSLPGLQMPS